MNLEIIIPSDEPVRLLSAVTEELDYRRLSVTGHCTGQEAFDLLKQELGSRVEQMHAGYVLEI